MGKNLKISLVLVAVAVLAVAGLAALAQADSEPVKTADKSGPSASSPLVRANSHRLSTAADGKVTFVEFLDFECEACRAAFPAVEQLRKDYDGRVTFVVRYFPIPSHFNAERAARAVEAAAGQGAFDEMYQKMYETQSEWGEQQVPADAVFRGFAVDLGLDMPTYDAAYKDPATVKRIRKDVADGQALGVQGTPTFVLNGKKLEPRSYADLTNALDAALGS